MAQKNKRRVRRRVRWVVDLHIKWGALLDERWYGEWGGAHRSYKAAVQWLLTQEALNDRDWFDDLASHALGRSWRWEIRRVED